VEIVGISGKAFDFLKKRDPALGRKYRNLREVLEPECSSGAPICQWHREKNGK